MPSVALQFGGASYSGGSGSVALAFQVSAVPLGRLRLAGVPVTLLSSGPGFGAVAGNLLISGHAAALSLRWTGLSPVGALLIGGAAAPFTAHTIGTNLGAAAGNLLLAHLVQPGITQVDTNVPNKIWPGFSSDGVSISLPIAALPGVSAEEADASAGDWRAIAQGLCDSVNNWFSGTSLVDQPTTARIFLLEDWNRKDTRFGRHMKRLFLIEFIVENSPTTVFNSGE